MTKYNVHIYREMKLCFGGIEASTPEAAADHARDLPTEEADGIDDCEGTTLSALVDVLGDEQYEQSRFIDFEPERMLKASPVMLDALFDIKRLAESSDDSGYDMATLLEMIASVAIAAIATTEGTAPPAPREPITIEVRGGVVQAVLYVPPGYEYKLTDYDTMEADEETVSGKEDGTAHRSTLPPDPDGINDDRAAWAGRAISAFQQATGTDDEDALSDLLADLIHWADRNNCDFDAALLRGRWHYDAETAGEDEA